MANQIKLLSYTIAKLINPKIKIYEISGKWWYVIRDEKFKIIDDRLTKTDLQFTIYDKIDNRHS